MTRYDELMERLDKSTSANFVRGSEVNVRRLVTPSIGLTVALGGGWGLGRQALIYGSKSATKSSFCMEQAGIAQREGLTVAYFDVEGTYDKDWAARLGCDTEELIYTQTGTVTGLVNDARKLMQAGVDVIMVDSITGLMPTTYVEKDGELKDHENTGAIGGLARSMSSALSQLSYANNSSGNRTLLLLISQTRKASYGMHWADSHTGGQSVTFYSSQVVKFFSSNSDKNTIKGQVKAGNRMIDMPVGRNVNYSVENNKLGPQGGSGSYSFFYRGGHVGIDTLGELVQVAVQSGVITKAGPWYKYDGETIGQGAEAATNFLRDNQEVVDEIKEKL